MIKFYIWVLLCFLNLRKFSFSFQNVPKAKKQHFSFKKTQFLKEKFQIFKTEKKKLENTQIHNQSNTQLNQ